MIQFGVVTESASRQINENPAEAFPTSNALDHPHLSQVPPVTVPIQTHRPKEVFKTAATNRCQRESGTTSAAQDIAVHDLSGSHAPYARSEVSPAPAG